MTQFINGLPLVADIPPSQHGTGYVPRDFASFPLKSANKGAAPPIQRFTMAEMISTIIPQKTADNSWPKDHAIRVGSPVKDQGQSSYCWAHAPTRGMEYAIILSGDPVKVLSAFYTAYPIKRGRNEGGSGIEAVQSLSSHGTCIEYLWPPQTFRGNETAEVKDNAGLHQITIYEDLDAADHELIYSSVCQGQPVTVGIPAWGHEVLLTGLVVESGSVYPIFDNSWGKSYGDAGRGVLHGKMTRFDEAGRIAAVEQSIA